MEEKNLICIGCPMGCPLTVKMENGKLSVLQGIPVSAVISMRGRK
jgi:CxxC motif-containing protein